MVALQVCVPQLMALVLTFPERVTEHNIEKLKQRVLNGGWLQATGRARLLAAARCELRVSRGLLQRASHRISLSAHDFTRMFASL